VSGAEHLARLTGWEGHGTPRVDWKQAEEEVGIALPPDFCELAERFPFGVFQGYLDFVPSIGGLVDLRERPLDDLRRWRDNTPDDEEIRYRKYLEELAALKGEELPPDPVPCFPFPLWPEPGGIFPWGLGSGDEFFFWLRSGPDPGSWPVVWCHGDDPEWEQFDGTTTEFLIALVTGQVDTRRLGSPIFPPPPRFDDAGSFRYRPTAGSPPPPSDEEIARLRVRAIRNDPDGQPD
jgi:hypothetical protein